MREGGGGSGNLFEKRSIEDCPANFSVPPPTTTTPNTQPPPPGTDQTATDRREMKERSGGKVRRRVREREG